MRAARLTSVLSTRSVSPNSSRKRIPALWREPVEDRWGKFRECPSKRIRTSTHVTSLGIKPHNDVAIPNYSQADPNRGILLAELFVVRWQRASKKILHADLRVPVE